MSLGGCFTIANGVSRMEWIRMEWNERSEPSGVLSLLTTKSLYIIPRHYRGLHSA
jgi:hypothetical protein